MNCNANMAGKYTQIAAVPAENLPNPLPEVEIGEDIDHSSIASTFFSSQSLCVDDTTLTSNSIWRDVFALTGSLRTIYGKSSITSAWGKVSKTYQAHDFQVIPGESNVARYGPKTCWIEARFTFYTRGTDRPGGKCWGILGLIPDSSTQSWKIWMISTMLDQVDGFKNPDSLEPALPSPIGLGPDIMDEIDCAIIGSGFTGLCVAGHLKALGVSYRVFEKYDKIGQNWTDRYHSVKQHTSKYYGQLPFDTTFGVDDPYFLNSSDLARGYTRWERKYGIGVQLSSKVDSASWDPKEQRWTVTVDSRGTSKQYVARHLVLAVGAGGQTPKKPVYPNRDLFGGFVIHSNEYKSARDWKGKQAVIIGAGCSAFDIAEDMVNAGLSSVTMVQRNAIPILPLRSFKRMYDPLYNEHLSVGRADREMLMPPLAVGRAIAMSACRLWADETPQLWDRLEEVGFKADRYIDMIGVVYGRFGGYYLDVGGLDLVANGSVKTKFSLPTSYTPTGLLFSDESTIDADIVILATGFEANMRQMAKSIVGPDIAEQLDDFWGLDAEGEIRGFWKPIGHPNIWYAGGGSSQARFYSRFLAFQIKAEIEGMPFVSYIK